MRRWNVLVDRFVEELEAREVGEGSIRAYRHELLRLGDWLRRRRPRPKLAEVDAEHIAKYLKGRCAFLARSSTSGVMSKLRVWGRFLVREGAWRKNPLRWMEGPRINWSRQVPRRITRKKLAKLLAEASLHRQNYYRRLWFTIVVIFYATGMRRGELERLDVTDWDPEAATIRVDGRKTGAERILPVADTVADCIESYLPQRQNKLERWEITGEEALFVDRKGTRLTGHQISTGIHRLAESAGVELVTLHQFRHTCASDLLEEGRSLSEVQELLGHAAVDSTMRYLHVADPERVRAISAHPVNAMLNGKENSHE